MKPVLKAPETKRLKLNDDEPLSSFAFNINLRHYSTGGGGEEEEEEEEEEDGPVFGPMMPPAGYQREDGYQSQDGDGGGYPREDDSRLRMPLLGEDDKPVPTTTSLQAFEPPTDDDEPESDDDDGPEFTGEVPGRGGH